MLRIEIFVVSSVDHTLHMNAKSLEFREMRVLEVYRV